MTDTPEVDLADRTAPIGSSGLYTAPGSPPVQLMFAPTISTDDLDQSTTQHSSHSNSHSNDQNNNVINPTTRRANMLEKLRTLPRSIRNFYPVGWKEELKQLLKLLIPAAVANVMFFAPVLITMLFAGTVNTTVFGGVAIALTIINMTGTSVGLGLTTALDTLLSQTFGIGQKQQMSTICIKGAFIFFLCCFPCWAIYVNSESLLRIIGEPAGVAREADVFVLVFIFGLPGLIGTQIFTKYLQNQNFAIPPMIVYLLIDITTAILQSIFVIGLKWSTVGCSVAMGLSYWIGNGIFVGYIIVAKKYAGAWAPLNLDIFQEWGKFMALALPGLLMVALETVNYEIGTLLSGTLGKEQLEIQAVMYQMMTLAFMVPFGIAIAVSIRVGHHLGEGDSLGARTAFRLGITLTLGTSSVTFLLFCALRTAFPAAFIRNQSTIDLAAEVVPIMAVGAFLDGLQQCCSGALRGCGLQKLGAMVNFIGFYVIGLPIGLSLMLKTDLKVKGFWFGVIVGVAFQCIAFNFIVAFTNWDKEVEKAKKRTGVEDAVKTEKAISDLVSSPISYSSTHDTAVVDAEFTKTSTEAVSPPDTHPTIGTGVIDPAVMRDVSPIVSDITMTTDDSQPYVYVHVDRLTLRQLALRRGLAFGLAVLVLIVGVVIRRTVPLPPAQIETTTAAFNF